MIARSQRMEAVDMSKLTLTKAFAHYGATLRNVQWAVSDIADDHLVVSLWAHKFRKIAPGVLAYKDRLSRWSGPGNTLFQQHLQQAVRDKLLVQVVMVRTNDTEAVDQGVDASTISKRFFVRDDLIGQVTRYDGDDFLIEFKAP